MDRPQQGTAVEELYMAKCPKCSREMSFWKSMCDSCFSVQIAERMDNPGEADRRRASYARVREENQQRIEEVCSTIDSPLARLLAQYLGQQVTLNLPGDSGITVVVLVDVSDAHFTVTIGESLVSHHPLVQIVQVVESADRSGVPFSGGFSTLGILLNSIQPEQKPTTFSAVGVGVSIPIGQ
jgi:hypothetical protein